MHANIGPEDSVLTRLILKVDVELQQVAPNLTFIYDAKSTPADLLHQISPIFATVNLTLLMVRCKMRVFGKR